MAAPTTAAHVKKALANPEDSYWLLAGSGYWDTGGACHARESGRKPHKVVFRPQAEADLVALYTYIADAAGPVVAGGYIDRIEAACLATHSCSCLIPDY
jgi:hypothetical protein